MIDLAQAPIQLGLAINVVQHARLSAKEGLHMALERRRLGLLWGHLGFMQATRPEVDVFGPHELENVSYLHTAVWDEMD